MLNIQKNILLSGTMRSGTTLMNSTLDAHPKISMVSDILNWFWSKFFPKYGDISSVYELDRAIYELEYFITYGLNLKQKFLLDKGKIKEDTIANKISSLSFYYSLINNFYYSDLKPYIGIKATHQAKFYKVFLDYTPNSYIVHMVRNPIDSFYSHKLRTPEGKKQTFKKYIYNKFLNLGLSFENEIKKYYNVGLRAFTPYIYKNSIKFLDEWVSENKKAIAFQKEYPDQIIILKFEDLISDKENSLKKLFVFLGIEWNDKVLEYEKLKDRNGNQFKANSSFKKNKNTKTTKIIIDKPRYLKYLNKEELNYYYNNVHDFAKEIGFNVDLIND